MAMPDESGLPEQHARHDRPEDRSDESTATIGLFPLGFVLMPGAALPIHVFENRYRELVGDVTGPGALRAFGVVSLVRGTETSRDVEVSPIGTLAEIVELQRYPDGTVDLLTMGSRRFRVLEIDSTSRPYLQARIEWLPEDEGRLPGALLLAARALCHEYCELLAELSDRQFGDPPSRDPLKLSYEIAVRLHLHEGERQRLLAATSVAERLRIGATLLRREIALVQRTRTLPVSARAVQLTATPN